MAIRNRIRLTAGSGVARFEAVVVRRGELETRVLIGTPAARAIPEVIGARRAIAVVDRGVPADLLGGLWVASAIPPESRLLLTGGESLKQLATAERLWRGFADLGLQRDDVVMAIGGGALLDVVGFAASTYMRGVPWLVVPTTPIAQIDACIGGKTAISIAGGKNLIGSFHWPIAAVIDSAFLATVPERDRLAARFELLKCAWIGDPSLGRQVASLKSDPGDWSRATVRALRLKARLVQRDPRDRGARRTLNLGHTFGHALEAAGNFRVYRHGEAVGIGLLAAASLSRQLGLVSDGWLLRRTREVLELDPPAVRDAHIALAVRHAERDKKRSGAGLVVVLPVAGGTTVRAGVSPDSFSAALTAAARQIG